jgi:hypothetical protein
MKEIALSGEKRIALTEHLTAWETNQMQVKARAVGYRIM